jgi:parallel beta-helix repeat protein
MDGSVDPPTAPIITADNVTYSLTGNITSNADGIAIERDDIIVDGNNFTLQGNGMGKGLNLYWMAGGNALDNVAIKNIRISRFEYGIYMGQPGSTFVTGNSTIKSNMITGCTWGISLGKSNYNSLVENVIANVTNCGILVGQSVGNNVSFNIISDTHTGAGVYLSEGGSNIIGNNVITDSHNGIGASGYSSNNTIIHNNIISRTSGISLQGVSNNTVVYNSIISSYCAVHLRNSIGGRFRHNNFLSNYIQVVIEESEVNTWDDGYPSGGNYWGDYTGVDLLSGPYQDQTSSDGIGDTPYFIDADNSDNYPLMQPYDGPVRNLNTGQSYPAIQRAINNATEGDRIFVLSGTYYENVVVNKTVSLMGEDGKTTIIDGNRTGTVVTITANNVLIDGFTIQNSGNLRWDSGIYLLESSYNYLTNITVRDNNNGIHVMGGSNVLRNIDLVNNTYNFGVWGDSPSDFIQDIDTSNKVNGKPIYFYVNRNSEIVPEDVGYLGIVNSQNITVSNLNISKNGQGILLAYSNYIQIENVTIFNNRLGVHLFSSAVNLLDENFVQDNEVGVYIYLSSNNVIRGNAILSQAGISSSGIEIHWSNFNSVIRNQVENVSSGAIGIWGSYGNGVYDNKVENNRIGIVLDSQNTIIIGNTIKDSSEGMQIQSGSQYNTLYHNNFINNTVELRFTSPYSFDDAWDNGCEGNYWSDYNGTDISTPPDGIGDTFLLWQGVDYYPLMNPYWNPADINHDLTVEGKDIAITAKAFSSYPTHPRWNPHADINQDDMIEGKDIATVAKNFGKTYP